jgi:hypothetical protein
MKFRCDAAVMAMDVVWRSGAQVRVLHEARYTTMVIGSVLRGFSQNEHKKIRFDRV